MDQNNMGGMNFVTGDETVPENTEINQTLSNVVSQPMSGQLQNGVSQPVQEVAPTLSSVISQPSTEQSQIQNNAAPAVDAVTPTISGIVSQPMSEQPQNGASQPVQEVAPTLSSVISQPSTEQSQIQNNVEPTSVTSTLPGIVSQPMSGQPQNVAPQLVQEVAPALSSVINQPDTEQSQIQNNAVLTSQNNAVNPGATSVTNGENADGVKQNKITKILIVVVVILALTAIGIVLGFVLFDKFGAKEEVPNEDTTVVNNNLIQANVINNVNVDGDDLSSALSLLGISALSNGTNVNALTYYVTDENYRDNAKEIITYYAILGSGITSSFDINDYKEEKDACADTDGCAIVSKEDAEKILRIYDFEGKLDDYLYKSTSNPDVYGIHYEGTLDLPQFNGSNLGIGHDLVAKYIGDEDIDVEDTQVFKYNDDDGKVKTVNRVVKYTFKKNDNDEYHLDNVLINE